MKCKHFTCHQCEDEEVNELKRLLGLCWNAITSKYNFPISHEEEMKEAEQELRKYFKL